MGLQSADGSWTDWELPPGNSSIWTTAYIGYKLRLVPTDLKTRTASARRVASEHLLEEVFQDFGWGYNKAVGSDADSTALAVLFLASEGRQAPEPAYSRLRQFQSSDGGFSTYPFQGNPNSWVVSHPDVTPVALLALLTKYSANASFVCRGIDYIVRQRTAEGLWNSFWWDSFLYGTEASLALLTAAKVQMDMTTTRRVLLEVRPSKAFEVGLLIMSLLHIGSAPTGNPLQEHVDQLIQLQEPCGSWRSEPILRVTRRDCFEPWNCEDPGPLFADPGKLFTSAAVIEAMSSIYQLL